ncbi:MAG: LysM peptidoglycan-binding domain-containing protein [Bacillota bacterium]
MKRFTVVLLSLLLALSIFSITAFASSNQNIRSTIIDLTTKFHDQLIQDTSNDYRVKDFDSKDELIKSLTDIVSSDIAVGYVNSYYYEKDDQLYLIAKDGPIMLKPNLPFQITQVDNSTYEAVQENQNMLYGRYTLTVTISRLNEEWKITGHRINIINGNVIRDVKEKVRETVSKSDAELGTASYVIKSGDTLSEIAIRHNTTVSNILVFNDYIENPDLIYPGDTLIIPESPPESKIYTVQRSDTLADIAEEFGTQVHTIVNFNYIENPDLIYTNQRLVVPVSLKD